MSKCKLDKKWTRKDLEALLKDGAARLVPASWTKSECWTRFRCVEVGNEIIKEFAVCKQCGLWLSVPIGHTTTLQRHNASHTKAINVELQTPVLSIMTERRRKPYRGQKEKLTRAYNFLDEIKEFHCKFRSKEVAKEVYLKFDSSVSNRETVITFPLLKSLCGQ